MGRSKESLKRKRSSRSKDIGHRAKRYIGNAGCSYNAPETEISSQTSTDNSTRRFCDVLTYPQIPYYSWITFFNSQEYREDSPTVKKIDALIDFFNTYLPPSCTFEDRVDLDVSVFIKNSELLQKWSNLVSEFRLKPHYTLNCINVALFEAQMRRAREIYRNLMEIFRHLQLNRINLINHESIVSPMTSLKMSSYGKLISISCRAISLGMPKFSSASRVFSCQCGRTIIAKQLNEGNFTPEKCNVCGNGRFKSLLDSPYEISSVSQTLIAIGRRPVDRNIDEGANSPNEITIRLGNLMIDKCSPGDNITVIGIPRITVGGTKSSSVGSRPLYLDAISVTRADDDLTPNSVHGSAIERIRSEPDVFSLLVHSLCPTVQGHEMIKAALILSLVGGSFENKVTRDSVHTLIIGNLGLGKTQLLRACAEVAPRGAYIPRDSSLSLIPTMTNVRENGTEDCRLEAGSIAMASRGFCCIDDLDKIVPQHRVLCNFMKGQKANVTNSELNFGVADHTSILAIINPIKKRYDASKTVVENVNASAQLLSRFDMIFLMRDEPNQYSDKLMCDRLLENYTGRVPLGERKQNSNNRMENESHGGRDRDLREILLSGSITDTLPQILLREYINHARSGIRPEISDDSKVIIETFCHLRYQRDGVYMKPDRLFRLMVLLIQARARIDSRTVTTKRDAFDVVEILEQTVSIEAKTRGSQSSRDSNKLTGNKMKQFLDDLRNDSELLNRRIFTTEELRNIAGKENVTGNAFQLLLTRLNDQGHILKVSRDKYRVVLN